MAAGFLFLALVFASGSTTASDLSDLERSLTRHTRYRYAADLDEIKRRGVLRVLTRNNSSSYFIARGGQRGFEYELALAFAKELGVRIAVVVPPSRDELITALLAGEGDIIAAGTTVTPLREEVVAFTRPVLLAPRVVVTHPQTVKILESLADLRKFTIHLSFRSTTYRDARSLEKQLGAKLLLADVPDDVEMEEMMRRVVRGEYEATIVDEDLLALEKAAGSKLEARVAVSEPRPKGWAFHPGARRLRDAADDFVRRQLRSGLIRILYAKYYKPKSRFARSAREDAFRADQAGRISPWDDLFRKAGEETGLDWRLLAALSYTESRFDPKARSDWGAVGLMQVLPNTGKEVGFADIEEPENNVRAGARYFRRLIRRFAKKDGIDRRQQIRFALASYNAGLGHVLDARALAESTGRDKNRWFGNVEEALRLKKQREWHEKTRFGYCRADETIGYVSRVQARYDVYVRHVPVQ